MEGLSNWAAFLFILIENGVRINRFIELVDNINVLR